MSFFCSRLGLRVVNRHNSNSGAKEFVLSLLNKRDKTLSNHQIQKFMGDPVADARLECTALLAVAGTARWMDVSKQLAWFIHIR